MALSDARLAFREGQGFPVFLHDLADLVAVAAVDRGSLSPPYGALGSCFSNCQRHRHHQDCRGNNRSAARRRCSDPVTRVRPARAVGAAMAAERHEWSRPGEPRHP